MFTKIEDIIVAIKKGEMVIVVDDGQADNEGTLVGGAEFATKETVNFMMKQGGGLISVALEERKVEGLGLEKIAVDYNETKNGVSAEERAMTIEKLIEDGQVKHNFRTPGHIFVVKAINGGTLKRASKVEAAVDLVNLAGIKAAAVISEILNEDGETAKLNELVEISKAKGIKLVSIEDLIAYRREIECYVVREAEANLPTAYGDFRMIGFVNRLNGEHHVALVKGEITEEEPTLVRVHSECLTGDAFHSLKCDCGEQLASALAAIEKEGKGILLYLRQEGRGIGLINKIKAYKLQEEGMDTEEANLALGFPSDMRDYGIGAQILSELKAKKLKLMTNNPKKIIGIRGHGIEVVERVTLIMETNLHNARYFSTKKEKMGHLY